MTTLSPLTKNLPKLSFLAINFIAGVLGTGCLWLTGAWVPLFIKFLVPPVLLILAIIFVVKKSQNRHTVFISGLMISHFLGLMLVQTAFNHTTKDMGGLAVFVFFYLLAVLGTYQAALDTKKPASHPLVFILVFGFFAAIAILTPLFAPIFYIGLLFALVRWLVRWFLTDMPRKDLKLRLVSSLVAVLLIESSIFYQTYQLKQASEATSQKVLAYYQQHGDYPLTDQIGKFSYMGVNYYYEPKDHKNSQKNQPYLSYSSLFTPFCKFNFDFKAQKWQDYCTD